LKLSAEKETWGGFGAGEQTDGGAEARVEDGLKAGLLRAEGEAKVEYPPLTEEFPPLTEEEAPLTEEEGDAGGAEVRVEEGLKAGLEAAADQTKEDEHMEELEHVEKGILLALLVACGAAALLVLAALVCTLARPPSRPEHMAPYPVCMYPPCTHPRRRQPVGVCGDRSANGLPESVARVLSLGPRTGVVSRHHTTRSSLQRG